MGNSERVRVVLLEDQSSLRREYTRSLIKNGFEIYILPDGYFLKRFLQNHEVEIILSDTEMDKIDGPNAVRSALENSLVNDDVLIIGMSDDEDNKDRWRGIAHYDCFFNKDYFPYNKIGEKVRNAYNAFKGPCKGWRMRMPVVEV